MNRKRIVTISILGGIIVLIAGLNLLFQFLNRIPKNPVGTVGNTASNLYNGGYFCETDGVVYFANAYDNYALYSMSPDETNLKKLTTNSAKYINAGGDYIYYYESTVGSASGLGYLLGGHGFFRLKKANDAKPICLHKTVGDSCVLIDNSLYYQTYDDQNAMSLYKTDLNGNNQIKLSDEQINPVSVNDGRFYYNHTEGDLNLYVWDTTTDTTTPLWDTDVYCPTVEGNDIYFLNIHENYELCCYHLDSGSMDVLTEDRVDFFNLTPDSIIYQTAGESPALKRMPRAGGAGEIIAEGAYTNINVTSQYIYYQAFQEDAPVYHTPINGFGQETFDAAFNAVVGSTE